MYGFEDIMATCQYKGGVVVITSTGSIWWYHRDHTGTYVWQQVGTMPAGVST